MIMYPYPLIISQGSGDNANLLSTNQAYLNLVRASGSDARFRLVDTSIHGTLKIGTQVDDGEGVTGYPISIEVCRFFQRYL
jgi:hypothetical protein